MDDLLHNLEHKRRVSLARRTAAEALKELSEGHAQEAAKNMIHFRREAQKLPDCEKLIDAMNVLAGVDIRTL